ncbi:MAG: hypothetical protein AB8G96_08075, partial [Phycisphaerales bacterium]
MKHDATPHLKPRRPSSSPRNPGHSEATAMYNFRFQRRLLAASAATLLLTPIAAASGPPVIDWLGRSIDSFLDAKNWDGGRVPGPGDVARFAQTDDPIVTVPLLFPPVQVRNLWFERGLTTIRAQGSPDTPGLRAHSPSAFDPGILVAGASWPRLRFGASDPSVSTSSMTVGLGPAGPGRAESPNTLTTLTVDDRLAIGDGADGSLFGEWDITAGPIAVGIGASGEIMLEDGSIFSYDRFQIGTTGTGLVTGVQETMADELQVGLTESGFGELSTQSLTVQNGMDIGVLGTGTVTSFSTSVGGSVTLGLSRDFDFPDTIFGRGTWNTTGSSEIDGDLVINVFGDGEMVIAMPVNLVVNGEVLTYGFGDPSSSSVTFRLQSSGPSTPPLLQSDGRIQLPAISVVPASSIFLTEGRRWVLADAGTTLTHGPLTLPPLPNDLAWRVTGPPALDDLVIEIVDASPPVFGDLNDDGIVDFVDLLFVMNLFGACPASGPCPADLDGNDSV